MELSPSIAVSSIKHGEVYYFSCQDLTTDEPHYFVCIHTKENDFAIFTCCTTQKENLEKYLQRYKKDYSTVVYIEPNADNGLKKETYMNCNAYFRYSHKQLTDMFDNKKIKFKGKVTSVVLSQIHAGILASDAIEEEIKDLLIDVEI